MHRREKENQALEEIFYQHHRRLFISALAVTGCPARAEDAVQEAFYKLFRLQKKPRHLEAYVFRSVRNAAWDQLRKNPSAQTDISESIFDPHDGPAETIVQKEYKEKLSRLLKELSADERETIISHIWADLSFRQIAKIRQNSINTVSSWYRRGMEKLRRQLEDKP